MLYYHGMSSEPIPADGRLHVQDVGRGPVVVCVHGTPTFHYEWRHVVAAVRDTHRVIAPDHLGFGASERPPHADYSPEAHARRFRAMMAALVPHDRVTLVVHDFGGPIALDWALDHPGQLERVIVVNSWMWPFDDDRLMRRRARIASGRIGRWLYRHANASLRLIMPSAYGNRRALTPEIHRVYLERILCVVVGTAVGIHVSADVAAVGHARQRLPAANTGAVAQHVSPRERASLCQRGTLAA